MLLCAKTSAFYIYDNLVRCHAILWPQNSPDLIPVGYKVWEVTQERVYRRPVLDVTDLKWRLTVAYGLTAVAVAC